MLKKVYSATPLDYSNEEKFPILECKSCGNYAATLVANESFEDLYSGGNYDSKEGKLRGLARPFLDVFENLKASWIYSLRCGGRLLEVGCGKGRFLLAAKRLGFDVAGIEPAERSYNFARKHLGERVSQCDLETYAKNHQKHFNVVLWHVFEHIENSASTLNYLKELLSENGLLIMAVPNWSSFQAKIGKKNWYHLDPPRHLHHFAPVGLKELLEKNGFSNIVFTYRDFYQDFMGDLITLINLVTIPKNVLINSLKKNSRYNEKYSIFLRASWLLIAVMVAIFMLLPLGFITIVSELLRRSGTFTIIAKKGLDPWVVKK